MTVSVHVILNFCNLEIRNLTTKCMIIITLKIIVYRYPQFTAIPTDDVRIVQLILYCSDQFSLCCEIPLLSQTWLIEKFLVLMIF